jgi:hypothetical protein
MRKLFYCGVYYHFLLALLIITALKGGALDRTANKDEARRVSRLEKPLPASVASGEAYIRSPPAMSQAPTG